MARMLELIRQSAVPETILRNAARGALALPAAESLEVLVALADHPMVGSTARKTLSEMRFELLQPVLSDPATPKAVLNYFLAPGHRRPDLLPALVCNPALPDTTIAVVAETAPRGLLEWLLREPRAQASIDIMVGMAANPNLQVEDLEAMKARLKAMGAEMADTGSVFDYDCALWMMEHAAEIAAEMGKAFELTEATAEEQRAAAGDAAALAAVPAEERDRISTVQKIARLSVGERVQLAMKGTKDERFVLIRDGSKIVAMAVLESPKVNENEVEMFAGMKNVQEDVLRGIARKRRFIKNYNVVRALVNNPRAPLDVALSFISHLHVNDLKALSMNKNIADTVRKLALKQFREKSSGGKRHD